MNTYINNSIWVVIAILASLVVGCDNDEDKLTPSTEPEFRYILPQGNHDFDTRIVKWFEDCGFYILYKFEDKDVFYNESQLWAGFVNDTVAMKDNKVVFYNQGYVIEQPDEAYVGKQLAWIEEMFLNHYPAKFLKKSMCRKIILAKNVSRNYHTGQNMLIQTPRDYVNDIANTLIFSYGDASFDNLSDAQKKKLKEELHIWFLCEKLVEEYPEMEEFYAVTNYEKTLDAMYFQDWMSEGWLLRLSSSVEAAKVEDVKEYIEMIITTPESELRREPSFMDRGYIGYLHPSKDVSGKIALKYDLIIKAFKEWGVDLSAIAALYN